MMKGASRSDRLNDWVSRQLQGTLARNPDWGHERRHRNDRRSRHFWSVLYGSFNPRRRRPARRVSDTRFQPVDWYSAHLLAVSIGILLLSAADAFLTGILLVHGADEINPIMAVFVYRNVAVFAALKMGLTSDSIVVMVFLSRYRFMKLFRVDLVLYVVLLIYAWLIGYEIWMLKSAGAGPLL
jgi:hypothetical protein